MEMVIDRFEGAFAVVMCEDKAYNIPRALLPETAKEGDILRIVIDTEKTKENAKEIKQLMDDVWAD